MKFKILQKELEQVEGDAKLHLIRDFLFDEDQLTYMEVTFILDNILSVSSFDNMEYSKQLADMALYKYLNWQTKIADVVEKWFAC